MYSERGGGGHESNIVYRRTAESCQNHGNCLPRPCTGIVTRKTTDSVVIMSLEDYEALQETAYLLRSPQNTRRLIESITQLEKGQGTTKELLD